MTEEPTNLLALRDAKQRARDLLTLRYSEGLIDSDELERRLDALENADTLTSLDAHVVVDLVEPGVTARAFLAAPPAPSVVLAHPRDVQAWRELVTLFSSTTRSGPWIPARHMEASVVFGELTLDFCDARLAPGVTTVELSVSLSSARLIVPPGLAVSLEVSVILSSLKRDPGIPELPSREGDPSLLVVGKVLFASLELRRRERPD